VESLSYGFVCGVIIPLLLDHYLIITTSELSQYLLLVVLLAGMIYSVDRAHGKIYSTAAFYLDKFFVFVDDSWG
jgi:hypothetical protein